MKQLIVILTSLAFLIGPPLELQARGRGGGGRSISRGGGGGGKLSRPAAKPSRPATPSFSRPSKPSSPSFSRPSIPSQRPSKPATRPSTKPSIPASRPSTRPSIPSQRPSTRPSTRPTTPSTRPSIKPGARPSIRPETRPAARPGDRPSTLPGTRPAVRPAERPSTLPGTRPGQRPTTRPGGEGSSRPSTLPGLGAAVGAGAGAAIATRPGLGDKLARPEQLPNRPSKEDRRDNLQDRLQRPVTLPARPGDGFRPERPDWGDRWDNNWHDRNWHHHHWHHGHWHGWSPGYWADYWWDRYPVLTVFGVSTWAINRLGWATGYYNYANPYYVNQSTTYYDYSQPIQVVESYPETAEDGSTPAPDVSSEGMSAFDRALQEFYDGKYDQALASTNEALQELPNDTAIHEFRALVLFALGQYQDSAATLYAVLSVGPGWDWTTMSSLYPSVDVYTTQLRALEQHRDDNPNDTAARFVLAYHYLTAGHKEAAAEQYQKIVTLNPQDDLSRNLLLSLDPDADVPKPEIVEPPQPSTPIQNNQLVGTWTAKRGGDQFVMVLQESGDFTWTFKPASGDASTVSGVWAVDEEGVLALDMGEEDVMLAQLDLQGTALHFYLLGDTQGAEPLKFTR